MHETLGSLDLLFGVGLSMSALARLVANAAANWTLSACMGRTWSHPQSPGRKTLRYNIYNHVIAHSFF